MTTSEPSEALVAEAADYFPSHRHLSGVLANFATKHAAREVAKATQCSIPGCDQRCPEFARPFCVEHGCRVCGGVILADTEDRAEPLCADCYEREQAAVAKERERIERAVTARGIR